MKARVRIVRNPILNSSPVLSNAAQANVAKPNPARIKPVKVRAAGNKPDLHEKSSRNGPMLRLRMHRLENKGRENKGRESKGRESNPVGESLAINCEVIARVPRLEVVVSDRLWTGLRRSGSFEPL